MASFIDKNASGDIAATWYKWESLTCQQYLWRLCNLYSNELHCIVPKCSSSLSLFQYILAYNFPHMYAISHSSELFLSLNCSQYLRSRIVLYNIRSFDCLSIQIMQRSNSYHHATFKICKYLIAPGYDDIQKSLNLCLWFERRYFINHFLRLVGIYECGHEASYDMGES